LKELTKGGGRYLCAFVKKVISEQSHANRVTYGEAHLYDPLFGFFDHIIYTDEAHVDPTSQAQGMVLRSKESGMTQKYYVDRLLPLYVEAIESMRLIDDKPWLLQEDGELSHGIRKRGLAQEYKEAHNIQNLVHSAQSPDIIPIEGIWSIIKQRLITP
jgi:hypothetical protein